MRLPGRLLCLLLLGAAAGCARKPASVQVSPRKVLLYGMDRSERLTARVLDNNGRELEGLRAVWSSSAPDVAAVDEGGLVHSKKEGKATITGQVGQVTAQVPVEVVDAAAIEVVPSQATLVGPPGTTFSLTAIVKNSKKAPIAVRPSWSSSNEKVVKVGPDGAVTSVGPGTASVTANVGELQGATEVTVLVHDIVRLELRPATALVRVGDSQKFQVAAYGADGVRLDNAMASFRSSNPAVATIDGAGVAAGVGAGTATIRVDLAGRTAEATLIVN
ncbi:MAG TPA: Ig-like domain-containing protein [Thermoanaerobaculia bacterium]